MTAQVPYRKIPHGWSIGPQNDHIGLGREVARLRDTGAWIAIHEGEPHLFVEWSDQGALAVPMSVVLELATRKAAEL